MTAPATATGGGAAGSGDGRPPGRVGTAVPPPPGPAAFFAERPFLYVLSVGAATAATGVMIRRALRASRPSRKAGWATLALVELGCLAGLLSLRRRPTPPPAGDPAAGDPPSRR